MGRVSHFATLGLLVSLTAATAQPARAPTESVTVTSTRSRQVLQGFVQSFAAPTRIAGKLARWQDGICPITAGLRPAAAQFVTQRVRDIAAKVGAPVSQNASCKPNIEIVFTTSPQGLADEVRKHHADYLGYHDNSSQADALAIISRPIQAWYTTATRDLRGKQVLDSARLQGTGDTPANGDIMSMIFSAAAVTGSRLGDGKTSALHHVIVVVEPEKLKDHEIGTVADYIAMLSLTQLVSLDACQQLPSIVNLLASGCAQKPNALTDTDTAYLRGLYRMGPGRTLRTQQDEVAYQMEQSLEGQK